MRRPRLAVQDALAAIEAADDAHRRPIEAFRVPGCVGVARAGLPKTHGFALDAFENVGRWRDRFLRQSVQPLNLIVAALRRDFAPFLRAIGKTRHQARCALLVVGKSETECPIGGDADLLAFEYDAR